MGKFCVFHHSDLDGMGVKILGMLIGRAKGYNAEDIQTYKCNYGDIDQIIQKRLDGNSPENDGFIDEILIGDISVQSKEMAETLNNMYYEFDLRLNLLDHHATAMWMNEYEWAKVREVDGGGVARCGTYWVFEEFKQLLSAHDMINDAVLKFVDLVDEYDTWRWMNDKENPNTDADKLNNVFKMMYEERFTEYMINIIDEDYDLFDETADMLCEVRNNQLDHRASQLDDDMWIGDYKFSMKYGDGVYEEVMSYYNEHRREDDKVGAEKRWYDEFWSRIHNSSYHKTFKVGVVYYNHDISDIGNRLLTKHPELDFIIFVCLPGMMSYRSAKELAIPLGIIAKYTTGSGGGHPESAGGKIRGRVCANALFDIVHPLENILNTKTHNRYNNFAREKD